MHQRLELDRGPEGSPQQAREQLPRSLNATLGPSPLLHQERGGGARQLGRHTHVVAESEAPAGHLRPVADVEVLGECVVLPAARVNDCLPAPQPRRTVEVEEAAAAVASPLFDQEVAVQEERLGARQPRFVFVEVVPAGLHHADPGIRHGGEEVFEEAGRGDEVGVEDEDVVTGGRFQPRGQGAGLVAVTGGAEEDGDVDALLPPLVGALPGEGGGVVGGVVEDLDLEEVGGVGEAAGGVDEALDDVPLVVDGELDGDAGGWGVGVGPVAGRPPP